jgi:DNA-binding NarL/FixJ family response regulator
MPKKVALVGHCGPDSSYLRMVVAKAGRDIQVLAADDENELKQLLDRGVDLLLLNRQLDYGFDDTEGVALIRRLHAQYANVKLMLVSNYPDAQAAAVKAGALPGFGKREMSGPRVPELIRAALAGGAGAPEAQEKVERAGR